MVSPVSASCLDGGALRLEACVTAQLYMSSGKLKLDLLDWFVSTYPLSHIPSLSGILYTWGDLGQTEPD